MAVEQRARVVDPGVRAISPRSREIGLEMPVKGQSELEDGQRARVATVGGASQVSLYFFSFLCGCDKDCIVSLSSIKSDILLCAVSPSVLSVFARVLWSDPEPVSYCFDSSWVCESL